MSEIEKIREEHAGDDGHVADASAHESNERLREIDEPPGDAAGIHDRPGQHEEWDGQQPEVVQIGK